MRQFYLDDFSLFTVIALAYCFLGGVFLLLTGQDPLLLWIGVVRSFSMFAMLALEFAPWWSYLIAGALILYFGNLRNLTMRKLANIVLAIILCSCFVFVFSMIKAYLPNIIPFWADPLFTRLDFALHFGINPRDLLSFLDSFTPDALTIAYHSGWVFIATFLPVLLITFDPCKTRSRQFIVLWAACWIVLGNFLALIFMSAGPIFVGYIDGVDPNIHGYARGFVEQENAKILHFLREKLWLAYSGNDPLAGSGISAFPSVHVGMAAVVGLYFIRLGSDIRAAASTPFRKNAALLTGWVAGIGTILLFLVLSVYLTWHYAVDGYAALIIIVALYALIRRSSLFGKKAQIHPSSGLNMPKA
ncbi:MULTISPECIES: phosphatase PAP2 family protein [Halocynthiibacter]|uniref:Phosphatase PAP2 family protein n=1 Tax=Halocynthiibacter halioticoli TaxID=2986804 RepID=A0AAE3J067_9RHOB|nr:MULTISPECIES: phosphatase PAP2 family protein [Halocynthiibacter]MCV6823726.1 phosphatase PAP2 family protein [Halocynthiibacter halioticoli]MCW4056727.1 phosphatase PAP2 family protein [Halocynthiibacter sp. SDUM655004]